MAGITDVFATVTVPKAEYEELVRESERNDIIRSLVEHDKFITTDNLKTILGIEETQEKEGIKEPSFEETLKKAGEENGD